MNLNKINTDGHEFYEQNNIDLTCPLCKGDGNAKVKPEGAKVESFIPTAAQVEAGEFADEAEHFRVVGIEALEGETYEYEGDAEEAMDDSDNWPEGDDGCDECGGSGSYEIMMNTIRDTGFSRIRGTADNGVTSLPCSVGPIVAFEHDGNVWLGMSGGGMDLSPYFCKAWLTLFPDVSWIPEDFISASTNLLGGYYRSCLGAEWEAKILAVYEKELDQTAKSARADKKRVAEYRRKAAQRTREEKKAAKLAKATA